MESGVPSPSSEAQSLSLAVDLSSHPNGIQIWIYIYYIFECQITQARQTCGQDCTGGWVGMPGLEAVFVQSPRAISRSRLNRRKVIQWRRGRTWRILVARKASSWDQWNRTTSSSAEWSRGSHKEWIARTNWPGARNVRRMQLCKCRKMSHGERR